jgi:hypothetical protein
MNISDRRYYANCVLEHVKHGLAGMLENKPFFKKDGLDSISIGSYQNGREQGVSLNIHVNPVGHGAVTRKSLWIAFAEYRRSDDVVVYISQHDPMQSLGENESIYKNSVMFNNGVYGDKFTLTAAFILRLIKALKEGQEVTTETAMTFVTVDADSMTFVG